MFTIHWKVKFHFPPKKIGKKNKLRTIIPKNHENFKNSKPRVQYTGSYIKKSVVPLNERITSTKFFGNIHIIAEMIARSLVKVNIIFFKWMTAALSGTELDNLCQRMDCCN